MNTCRRAIRLAVATVIAMGGLGGFGATSALAYQFGISSFNASLSTTQAGAHPDATVSFRLNVGKDTGVPPPGGNTDRMKDAIVQLPAGFIGNPTAVPTCPQGDLDTAGSGIGDCPTDTQIGTLYATYTYSGSDGPPSNVYYEPLYNLQPLPGQAAVFGVNLIGFPVEMVATVRTGGDYGITVTSPDTTEGVPLNMVWVTLWGVPAASSHDSQRFLPGPECPSALSFPLPDGNVEDFPACVPGDANGNPLPAGIQPLAFLTNPTSCPSTSPTATLSVDSWEQPGIFDSQSTPWPATTGCDKLALDPSISVQPDTSVADSPSGLNVDLSIPQDGLTNPTGLAEADLRNATVTLPAGVSVDPSAASGLTACTPDQIGIDNANAPTCPDSSKVGTVEIDTPLLSDPLKGGIYVAQQDQNPFGSLLAIYLTAYADGVWVKLAGHVVADPVTGQLTTTFSNNPQLPFTDFKLDFFGGSQGILATPQQCGTYTSTSDLSSYAGGPDATPSDSFTINTGCVSGFAPTFTAGATNPQAGAYSPFVLSFSRSDTDQNFQGLSVKLAPGMLAKLAGVQECSDTQLAAAAASSGTAQLANPSCPAGSQVGTVQTAAGPGPDPVQIAGSAYLTGPYKGAPYGIAVVVPAVAGPYDLGTVVVRQALEINPTTAQVTDVSDPFPTILQGIPLDIRQIDVDLNRPDFTVNPTSCNPMSVTGALTSTGGLTYNGDSHFQVGGCQDIGFSPKLKIALSGKGKTRSGDHPTLTATLTDRSGQANIRSAKVTLPLSMALDPNNSQHVCAYATAAAVHGGAVGCPTKTIVGKATADTPLLSKPLTGKVYLVQGLRCPTGQLSQQGTCPGGKTAIHTLPTLLVPLRGQIALDLRAKSSVNGAGALVTTFSTIPDAPVSRFTLQITGGKKGLLVITGRGQTICGKPQVASENLGAQSGKSMVADDTLTTPCKASRTKKR